MDTTSYRRRVLCIGAIAVIGMIFVGMGVLRMTSLFPGYNEIIYSTPGESMTFQSGEWFAKSFIIDSDHIGWGVGVEGVLSSHHTNIDDITLEFGYAPISLTEFMTLNDTEKRESFWGSTNGFGWYQPGIQYSTGHIGVGPAGSYVWAIRFIDLDDNSTIFATSFDISLTPM